MCKSDTVMCFTVGNGSCFCENSQKCACVTGKPSALPLLHYCGANLDLALFPQLLDLMPTSLPILFTVFLCGGAHFYNTHNPQHNKVPLVKCCFIKTMPLCCFMCCFE